MQISQYFGYSSKYSTRQKNNNLTIIIPSRSMSLVSRILIHKVYGFSKSLFYSLRNCIETIQRQLQIYKLLDVISRN